jgi:hypothetical protein
MRRTLIRTATLSLAVVALAAPTAGARPADPPPTPQQRLAQAEAESFAVRPVLDRSPVAPDSAVKPVPQRDSGVDWDTIGLFGGIGLLALAALAGVAVARLRRTHVTA